MDRLERLLNQTLAQKFFKIDLNDEDATNRLTRQGQDNIHRLAKRVTDIIQAQFCSATFKLWADLKDKIGGRGEDFLQGLAEDVALLSRQICNYYEPPTRLSLEDDEVRFFWGSRVNRGNMFELFFRENMLGVRRIVSIRTEAHGSYVESIERYQDWQGFLTPEILRGLAPYDINKLIKKEGF